MSPLLPFDPARRSSVAAHLGAPKRTVLRLARGFYRKSGMSVAGVRLRLAYLSADLFIGAFGRSLPSEDEVSVSLAWLQSRGVAEEVSPDQWRERDARTAKGAVDVE